MVSPPSLLVIGAGPFQRALLQTTQRMGITTIALDGNPKATSRALADRFIVCDISDIEAVLACARDLTIDGVISTASDIALPAHAAVAARLGLPGPSPESIVVARNKLLTAERLEKAGVPSPKTALVNPGTAPHAAGYPLVIKPALGAGGRGVSIIRDESELPCAIERARRYGRPLYQRFVAGAPLGLEAFIVGGRVDACFVLEDQLGPEFPSPLGHATPSRRYDSHAPQLRTLAQSVVDALELSDGGLNLDLRWTAHGPVVLEVNPRSGGAQLGPLIQYAYGVDLCAANLCVAIGTDPRHHLAIVHRRPAATRLFVRHGRGVIRRRGEGVTHPLDTRKDDQRVIAGILDVLIGTAATTAVDGWSLLGHCLVSGSTVDEAIALAQEIDDDVGAFFEVDP